MNHQVNTRGRGKGPPNLPYLELLHVPPSLIRRDFAHSSRGPANPQHRKRELQTREQEVRYGFHFGHLSIGTRAMAWTGLPEIAKIPRPRPTIHRRLSQNFVRVDQS